MYNNENPIKVADWSQPYKIALGILAVILLAIILLSRDKGIFGMEINSNTTATNTSLVASSTSAQALAANLGARKRVFANTGSNTIYLSEKTTSTFTAGTGITLFASTVYEETAENGNLWTGSVWAITSSGTSSLVIQEL